MYAPDLDFLHQKIQEVTHGFDEVESPIFMGGGFGYGQVSDHWRIGGFGFGGEKTISGTYPHPDDLNIRLPQDVTIGVGGGGFYTEFILGHLLKHFEGALSLGLGGAGVHIKIAQYRSSVTWDGLFDGFKPGELTPNIVLEISNGGFMLYPGIGLKYHVNSFFAIEGNASYMMIFMSDEWKFEGVTVRDTPDLDFNAPVFNLRWDSLRPIYA